MVLAGIALASGDVWSLLAVTALGGAGLAVRIRAEERQLTQALGAEYERFAAGPSEPGVAVSSPAAGGSVGPGPPCS